MDDLLKTIMQTRGAVTAVATALNITLPAVSQWRARGEVPANRREAVQAALEAHITSLGGPSAPAAPSPQEAA